MDSSVSLLKLQLQQNMINQIFQNTPETGKSSGTDSPFETLLSSMIGENGTGPDSGDTDAGLFSGFYGLHSYAFPLTGGTLAENGSGTQASDQLVRFIASHEGYSTTAYRGADYQNRTIGYGHVIEPGEQYASLSQDQALSLLQKDLSSCVESVRKNFADVKLSQNQFDALVSFAYNLGNNIWSDAPKLVKDIKTGASVETLKDDFTQFDHCNGKELQGLYNRRIDEWKLFTTGNYQSNP